MAKRTCVICGKALGNFNRGNVCLHHRVRDEDEDNTISVLAAIAAGELSVIDSLDFNLNTELSY